ncbi:MAG TPA: hypothetical protein VII60_02365 [Acidimicrobiales bacterium]
MSTPTSEGRHQWLTPRRLAASAAIVFLLAACVSDFIIGSFWARHTMLTAIVSTILVALVSLTVVEVILDQRSEQRWRLLAQYGLFELADNANVTWLTLLTKLNVAGAADFEAEQVHAILDSPDAVHGIRTFLAGSLAEPARRATMLKVVDELMIRNQALITRWNVVMTGSRTYVGLFDRHVELFTRVNFLQYYLRRGTPIGLKYWTTPASDPETMFLDTVISVLHVAVELEVETWTRALNVANTAWWFQRNNELNSAHATIAD